MIFDTDILIHAGRGVLSAKELIMSTRERSISAVTHMEYVQLCRNKREIVVFEKMLSALQFTIHEIDYSISDHARQMVRQYALTHGIEMGDALIAATALKYRELLCTCNAKHFTPISGLKLESYSPN